MEQEIVQASLKQLTQLMQGSVLDLPRAFLAQTEGFSDRL